MKHQLQTIRSAIEMATPHYQADTERFKQALTALAQIEQAVGSVEPFAYYVYFPDQQRGEFAHELDELCEDMTNDENHEVTPLYAAQPAQQPQYEAGDMASAHNDGFRAGVASVAQQPQELQDIEQYRLQMAGISTAAIGYWKESDSIHPDYDTLALRDVAKLYAKYDELYKAQQPQAELLKSLEGLLEAAEWLTSGFDEESLSDDVCRAMQCARATIAKVTVSAAPQQAEAVPSDVVRDVEAAAKKMAEIFDYPWDFMPEKGRNTMRENVRAILAAAQGEKP